MALPPHLYTFLCACFVANGAAIFGYDLGVIAYVLVAPDFLTTIGMATPETYNDNYIGFITSSMLLGAAVASMPAGLFADRFSRRAAITGAALVFIMGGIMQTACQNKETMLAGRFFAGMGIGSLGVLVPLYQSEIGHPAYRGRLTATFQFFLGIGALVAGWIAYGTSQTQAGKPIEWRLPLGLQMFPAVPLVFLTFLLPESPRWLMLKGRHEDALTTLARLHARGDTNDPFVRGEYDEMMLKVDQEASLDQSWSLIFYDKVNLRKVLYGIALQFSVQMTGVSAIQYYAGQVYSAVGFEKNALLINSINNVVALIGEALCILFVDMVGRRPPLIVGNTIAGICFAVATAMARKFAGTIPTGTRSNGITFVAMIYIYNLTFSTCIGPLSWIYPVETFNTAIRAKASSITTMFSWLANFMIGQVSPHAFSSIGWKYYIVFTVCSFTNAIFFYTFFPETKGRTLEEMDAYFRETGWIVPLAKVEQVGQKTRTRQLAHGERAPELETAAAADKNEYAHNEKRASASAHDSV